MTMETSIREERGKISKSRQRKEKSASPPRSGAAGSVVRGGGNVKAQKLTTEEGGRATKTSCCPSCCSFNCVSLTVFACYVLVLANTLVTVIFPGGLSGFDYVTPLQNGAVPKVYSPLWKEKQSLNVLFYMSTKSRPESGRSLSKFLERGKLADQEATHFLFSDSGIPFHSSSKPSVYHVNITSELVSRKIWQCVLNGNAYVHGHVYHNGYSPSSSKKNYNQYKVKEFSVEMGKLRTYVPPKLVWRLFPVGFCGDPSIPATRPTSAVVDVPDLKKRHWTPKVSFKMVSDFTKYPENQVPPLIGRAMRIPTGTRKYLPFGFVDSVGTRSDQYIVLNRTVKSLPLEIRFEPTASIGRWLLGFQMEESFRLLHESMGAEEKESDDIRQMLTETHPYLLLLTLIVTLLHTLFDILAFKSDMDFWRKLKSTRGLSTRSQVTSLFCQIVVTAYLHHEKGSMLVLLPSVAGIFMQAYKVNKMVCSLSRAGGSSADGRKPHVVQEEIKAIEKTKYFDNMAGTYLGNFLYPIALGSILHSAFCVGHDGYYGWFITSAVYVVYTFGFIIMTPQLFINYKLKSVAHLPWKFFMYRALNTFIDDLFAFIIKMPTMHRLSCFRDDIVFFIFLYQRWIYPVDMSRIAVGVSEEDQEGEKKRVTS